MEQKKDYKRLSTGRGCSTETAQKISQKLKAYNATHPRSSVWCKKISKGLQTYWKDIPPITTNDGKKTTMDDLI